MIKMVKLEELNEGDKVIKAHSYSTEKYCKYGGEEHDVPIGTKGKVVRVISDNDVQVLFDNGVNWDLDISEIEKEEKWVSQGSPIEFDITSSLTKQIIEKLSKNIDLVRKFDDVRVIEEPSETLAYTDIEHRTLYINSICKAFDFPEIIKMLNGLVIHEFGHLDNRLKVPANMKTLTHVVEELGKQIDVGLLNTLYDLEIHYQYNIRKMTKPTKTRELKHMITILRNKCFENEKTRGDIILSVEYPISELQQKVKKIVENRGITIIHKYKKIKDLLDKEEEKGGGKFGTDNPLTVLIFEPEDKKNKKGKGKGKGKQKSKKGKQPKPQPKKSLSDKLNDKSVSIKEDIEAESKLNEIKNLMASLGFSDEEIDYLCKKFSTKEIIKNVENLYKSFNQIIPELVSRESREKTRNHIKSKGNRINGYHKIRSLDEIVENPEDLMTIGKFDIEEIRIPTKIKRKTKGLIVLLRDVSGSVSSPPLDKTLMDTTTTLVRLAKDRQHRVGVLDFHSKVEPIKDRRGEILTTDYNIVLFESMKMKHGYSTVLTKALEKVNDIVKEKKLEDDNLNLFIITDSYVDLYEDTEFEFVSKKVNLVGIWCRESGWGSNIDENFEKFIRKHNGKIFRVEQFKDRLVANILEVIEK